MEYYKLLAIGAVLVGCMSNNVFLEAIMREVPSSGHIMTFLQFLFISIYGFFFTTKCLQVKPAIPIRCYGTMVGYFIIVSLLNNIAPNFHIPMPLHMIFRSGSLVATLILGIILLGKSYKLSTYLSVVMITVGISIATIVSAKTMDSSKLVGSTGDHNTDVMWMSVGVLILIAALLTTSRLGIYQEVLYKEYGKHPAEALFYSHALPLPVFIFFARDIYRHFLIYSASDPLFVYGVNFHVPKMWFFMLGNCLTQFICIRSVFVLTTEFSSLTVTLVVTLRKFLSLLVSIHLFQNPFTLYHWMAALLVFTGTFLFLDLPNRVWELAVVQSPKEQEKTE